MYDTEHPAYRKLGEIGKEITTRVKPRAVVVFSAHWQAGRDTIQVNTAEKTDLIYEYALYLAGRLGLIELLVSTASRATTIQRSTPILGARKLRVKC